MVCNSIGVKVEAIVMMLNYREGLDLQLDLSVLNICLGSHTGLLQPCNAMVEDLSYETQQ